MLVRGNSSSGSSAGSRSTIPNDRASPMSPRDPHPRIDGLLLNEIEELSEVAQLLDQRVALVMGMSDPEGSHAEVERCSNVAGTVVDEHHLVDAGSKQLYRFGEDAGVRLGDSFLGRDDHGTDIPAETRGRGTTCARTATRRTAPRPAPRGGKVRRG